MGKRTIPEIRRRLFEIAEEVKKYSYNLGEEIEELADETFRASPARRKAPVRHPPLTKEQKAEIVAFAFANPKLHIQDIAEKFNTNSGRVSEALHGQ
jgi:hypothetical protein